MDQCCYDVTIVTSLRANMAATVRTLLLLITDAVHRALLTVYYPFTEACWEFHHSHRGAQKTSKDQQDPVETSKEQYDLKPVKSS